MSAFASIPYIGEEKIVIAIDLGTTQSAVSYVHLFPHSVPSVRVVLKWPGQEEAAGDSKIPSIVCYEDGRPIAFGADALEAGGEDAEISRWFKLHLHPDSMKRSNDPPEYETGNVPELEIPPLPKGVTLRQVYAHFLRFLYDHTRNFFRTNTVDGELIWNRLEPNVHFVLATPNGWDVAQFDFFKAAAILGGLLPAGPFDEERLKFVTEGEASVHYALQYSTNGDWLQPGVVFAVCDAGGSTVDSTIYLCKEVKPKLVLTEVRGSECIQAGSVFVDRAAEAMITAKLANSKFVDRSYLVDILAEFEKKTKRKFDGTQATSIIKFGKDWDNDKSVGVWKGRLSLQKSEVASTFDACVPRIIKSCQRLMQGSEQKVKFLLLVGGFGESPYLRKRLTEEFASWGTSIVAIDEPTKKAAAEGAAIWFTKQSVIARAARFNLGAVVNREYNADLPSHRARESHAFIHTDGRKKLAGFFSCCVTKNQVISAEETKYFKYRTVYKSEAEADLARFKMSLWCFEADDVPEYAWTPQQTPIPGMRKLCELNANMSGMRLVKHTGVDGKEYFQNDHRLAVMFGGVSLKAKLCWTEGTVEREGPVTIIPDTVY